ncbi:MULTISPECIES: CoA transferase [Paraburkholderia]|uniref:CoA transferase n=1 Tax=Paraburkholderia TaxID=1822464 RepID=UPI001FE7BC77|nr:CoA transferase [Paraburkholderia podalyriae]
MLQFPEVCRILEEKGLAFSLIYSMEDIVADAQYQVRGSIVALEHPQFGELKMPTVQPRFSGTPSANQARARSGAHTDEVPGELAGLSAGQIAELRQAGTV